jgi:hypothetical protein
VVVAFSDNLGSSSHRGSPSARPRCGPVRGDARHKWPRTVELPVKAGQAPIFPYGKRTLYGSIQQNVATSHPLRRPASEPLRRPREVPREDIPPQRNSHTLALACAARYPRRGGRAGRDAPTAPRAQAVPNSGSDVVDQCAESGGDYEDQGTFHGKHYERCCYKATPFANAYCIQFVNGNQVSVGKETSASTPPPPPPPAFTPPTANAPAQ